MSTSGQIHREILRLLYIPVDRRTRQYFANLGDDEPGIEAFEDLALSSILRAI
jgi:hypothetical protein